MAGLAGMKSRDSVPAAGLQGLLVGATRSQCEMNWDADGRARGKKEASEAGVVTIISGKVGGRRPGSDALGQPEAVSSKGMQTSPGERGLPSGRLALWSTVRRGLLRPQGRLFRVVTRPRSDCWATMARRCWVASRECALLLSLPPPVGSCRWSTAQSAAACPSSPLRRPGVACRIALQSSSAHGRSPR